MGKIDVLPADMGCMSLGGCPHPSPACCSDRHGSWDLWWASAAWALMAVTKLLMGDAAFPLIQGGGVKGQGHS